jgi:hypothetical protein
MDEDGKHVWFEHICAYGQMKRDMLPWPHWKAQDGKVSPSIVCTVPNCGFHDIPAVRAAPEDWTPRVRHA